MARKIQKSRKVLSIDGGGNRGRFALRFIKNFCQSCSIPLDEIWRYHDVIGGTSIGGIIALALAAGKSIADCEYFFNTYAPWIFTNRQLTDTGIDASFPSSRPTLASKLLTLYNDSFFYLAVDPASNYGHSRLYQGINSTFGSMRMSELKTNVVIPSYDKTNSRFLLYSNVSLTGYTGSDMLVSDVAKATSAAPLYLPPADFNSKLHLDGGIFQNNPSSFCLTLSEQIYPSLNRACVTSVGTGLGKIGFDANDLYLAKQELIERNLVQPRLIESISGLVSMIDTCITGCQESVAQELLLRSAPYTLNNLYSYRFQKQLDSETYDTDLDNTDPAFNAYLDSASDDRFSEDSANISSYRAHFIL